MQIEGRIGNTWRKSTMPAGSRRAATKLTERSRTGWLWLLVPAFGLLALMGCWEEGELDPMAAPDLRPRVSVGVLEGDSLRIFGLITDVAVAPDGGFAVLDHQARNVRWFGPDGTFRGWIWRRGQGPGEMGRPNSVVWTPSGTLLILDSGHRRLSAFAPGGTGLEHLWDRSGGIWGTMGDGRTVCEVRGRIYLRRFDTNGMLVHEVYPDEDLIHSFEPAESVPEDIVAGGMEAVAAFQMNHGTIMCVDDPPMVLSLGGYSLVVRAFDPDGQLLWETRPEALAQRTWHLGSDGLPEHWAGDDENPTYYGVSIVPWGPDRVLAQFSTYATPRLTSVELDLRSGDERGRGADLPLFVAGTSERVWALDREPFPKLTVYDILFVNPER